MAGDEKPVRPKAAGKPEADASAEAKKRRADARAAKEAALKAAADGDEEEEADAREGDDKEEAPKPKGANPAKPAPTDDDGDDDEAPAEKKGKSKPRPKPKLTPDLKRALELRKAKSAVRQEFHRQEWFRYQRLGDKWRYPQGIQSKMRRHWGTHADVVSIGYRGPKAARGLHPSGFREVLVHNPKGLDGIDPTRDAVRIASTVGKQKRKQIQKDAVKKGIRVLNLKVWRD